VELPLTGYAAPYGEDAKRGAELAVDEINAGGGINGRKIEAIYEDDGAVGKTAVSATQKLVDVDKVPVIVGGIMASAALSAAPIARENKVVFVATISSHPDLTNEELYVYRVFMTVRMHGNTMAKYAYNVLKAREGAALTPNNDYGVTHEKTIRERFIKLGGKWLISESYAPGSSDFRAQLTKIKDKNPDIIFCPGPMKETAQMFRQIREMRIDTLLFPSSMLEDPKFFELAGNTGEGSYFTTFIKEKITKEDEYTAHFKAKFGKDPGISSKFYYDGMQLVFHTLKLGALTGPEINKALSQVKNFPGITGNITFDRIGDRIWTITVRKIEGKNFVDTGYTDPGD
jgi:branched-chain amino acid transport system substrate-binding protein